ncbi:DUF3048 domain-containing protein [Cellulomonas fimi]|uniref:DUF3048 domain-containing protein n=1 Tax=Cellulomonas fimi TaxID=1708 RepID=A0A7Y0LVP8_CELFI|nr:DUF3048 domain-containing protein [Cellulomonas fimi]
MAAVAVLGALLTVTACGADTPTVPTPVTEGPDIAVDKTAPPPPVVPPRWPLTGVAADEVASRPALAVKIENPREVRPQTGLDQADVVWEQVVEGGVTRLVAVYQSQVPAEVGPIRSVRPMDPAITAPMRGIIAFSGGQPGFVAALRDAGVQTVSHDAGNAGFYRTRIRPAPSNVFGNPQAFWDQADANHQAPPPEQFAFARRAEQATVTLLGTPAGALNIAMSSYSQPGWTWDAVSGTWLRSESGTAATAASGARLAASNVVALRVDLVDSGTRDPAGSVVPETRLVGTGEAVVATGGKVLTVTWTKSGVGDPLVLTTADGQVVKLAPGATWVELVPNGTGSVTPG